MKGTLVKGKSSVRLTSSLRSLVLQKKLIFAKTKAAEITYLEQGGGLCLGLLPFSKGSLHYL